MANIETFHGEWLKLGDEDDFELLKKSKGRHEAANKALRVGEKV